MVRIYHNPKCSKSRQVLEILQSKGLEIEVKLYMKDGLTKSEILEILQLLNVEVRDIMRVKEVEYKENNLDDDKLSQDELIDKIIEIPRLLERPIVINGSKAVMGRPPEKILDII